MEQEVEKERVRIVEASKQFVLDRENENKKQNQDLIDEIEKQNRKIENLQNKIKGHEDQCKQYEFELEQEKQAYSELVKSSEEKSNKSNASVEDVRPQFDGDAIRELQERLEKSKQQNDELRFDFTKMADDYDKCRTKEKREVDKLKAHCEKLKGLCEKKDVELKRLRALTKEPMKNQRLVEDLRQQLMITDEKFVALQLKNEDLENTILSNDKKEQSEILSINKKLTSLICDNDLLKKKLDEVLRNNSLLEKENLKLRQQLSVLPRAGLVSPLAKSMSTLKVMSSEDEDSTVTGSNILDCSNDETVRKTKSLLKNVTPKRNNESTGIILRSFMECRLKKVLLSILTCV